MQSLADFRRDPRAASAPASSRMTACVLTAAVYGLFALIWHGPFGMAPEPAPVEIVTKLVVNVPIKKLSLDPPPFHVRFIRPPVQSTSPPAFAVATEASPAPLVASLASTSPLAAGAGDSNGQGGMGNGLRGNGDRTAGCWDAIWAQAVRDRIKLFSSYPAAARASHASGVVRVRMIVRHDGWLDLVEVRKSSGNPTLDRAARTSVRKAQPLPAIPERMHADRIDAEIPITFGTLADTSPSADSCSR